MTILLLNQSKITEGCHMIIKNKTCNNFKAFDGVQQDFSQSSLDFNCSNCVYFSQRNCSINKIRDLSTNFY